MVLFIPTVNISGAETIPSKIWFSLKDIYGNSHWRAKLSMVDLVTIALFVKKKFFFQNKYSRSELVQGHSHWSFPFGWEFLVCMTLLIGWSPSVLLGVVCWSWPIDRGVCSCRTRCSCTFRSGFRAASSQSGYESVTCIENLNRVP